MAEIDGFACETCRKRRRRWHIAWSQEAVGADGVQSRRFPPYGAAGWRESTGLHAAAESAPSCWVLAYNR